MLSLLGSSLLTKRNRRPSTTSNNAHVNWLRIWQVGCCNSASSSRPTRLQRCPLPVHAADDPVSQRQRPTIPAPNGCCKHASDPSSSDANAGVARPVGSSFSPSDEQLRLTQEGYSPAVVRLVIRQGAKVPFGEASADLRELADLSISAMQVRRLCERVGSEWVEARTQDVQAFTEQRLEATVAVAPTVAAVMLDGGRVQTRAADAGRGVSEPGWQETKVACCLSLQSSEKAVDPQREPPAKLLEPVAVARLAAEMKARRSGGVPAAERRSRPQKRKQRRRRRREPRKLVRTVIASLANSDTFGYQMAAEVQRRRLGEACRKACVCDGQKWNWTLFAEHLLPWGFIGILDFLHLVSYLYAAAQAAAVVGLTAWVLYERWLRWAWAGEVRLLLAGLREAARLLGQPSAETKADDPCKRVADAVGYVTNNRDKMNYPEYRRQGLPINSAPVESVIKQLNRRIKGTEKFWTVTGVEAVLQLRAAYISEDGRAERYAERPRPRGRAVGAHRLAQKG
jgi:hypothetical protein